ncbi:serine hydrolase [Aquimarina sp. MMG015]|uniref:serine hydrolase n=1 Tax=Aquimarina sp. MMG015 TaxID=2822689 RepID=UPI001B3A194F|nr:serine hydrolase [Aquimarina sp. MMG015]MBQ4804192.1 serine hydrolase [Aquimarina sp. MMG015]
MKSIVLISFISLLMISCSQQDPLEKILNSDTPQIANVSKNIEKYEVQILYSQINRNKKGQVTFTDYEFNVSDSTYFYPASSVKFPIALLALEKLNTLQKNDIPISKETNFITEQDSAYSSIDKEIIKIFAVSDNQAYNRLFEFLGQDYINQKLNSKNINSRISHRLSTNNASNTKSQSLIFKKNIQDSIPLYKQSGIENLPSAELALKDVLKGKGYILNDSLISTPKDFSQKNYLPLRSLHGLMKRIQFPDTFTPKERFKISERDRDFIIKAMKTLPYEAGYDKKEYYDGYVKFFMFGDTKKDIPKHIEIYNKVGYAYGYLTDCAYFKDTKNNVEFILSATIHVNENEIYNDDNYEYDKIGIPFLAQLGRMIHDLEKQKSK